MLQRARALRLSIKRLRIRAISILDQITDSARAGGVVCFAFVYAGIALQLILCRLLLRLVRTIFRRVGWCLFFIQSVCLAAHLEAFLFDFVAGFIAFGRALDSADVLHVFYCAVKAL